MLIYLGAAMKLSKGYDSNNAHVSRGPFVSSQVPGRQLPSGKKVQSEPLRSSTTSHKQLGIAIYRIAGSSPSEPLLIYKYP